MRRGIKLRGGAHCAIISLAAPFYRAAAKANRPAPQARQTEDNMRQLIVHRQRALACFAMTYYCLPGPTRKLFDGAPEAELPALCKTYGVPLANGESAAMQIDDTPFSFFAAACLGGRTVLTESCAIPAGTADVRFQIITDYDGFRHLQVRLAPAE